MTEETYKKAEELMNVINYERHTIKCLDLAVKLFDDQEHGDVTVTCMNDTGGKFKFGGSELPELRDALLQARERFSRTLGENLQKLEAL